VGKINTILYKTVFFLKMFYGHRPVTSWKSMIFYVYKNILFHDLTNWDKSKYYKLNKKETYFVAVWLYM